MSGVIRPETVTTSLSVVSHGRLTPGRYRVAVPDTPLSQAAPVIVSVDLSGQAAQQPPTLTPALKPGAVEQINQLVRRQVDQCAQQTVLTPQGCPFGDNLGGDLVGPVHWAIVAYPALDISLASSTQARVRTRTNGQVTVSGTQSYLGQKSPFVETVPFSLGGTASVSGGSLTFVEDQ